MRCFFQTLFFLVFPFYFFAQGGYEMMRNSNKIEIPFEYKNNLMLVDVVFNRAYPLKFIFDTGAESTILSKRSITDKLGIPYEREFKVMGADLQTELKAYLIRNIYFEVGKGLIPRHSMLVLDEDYFRFEEMVGMEIHGILGADAFRGLVVKINYERQLITLVKKHDFKPPRGYQKTAIEVNRSKAYLHTNISISKGAPRKVKLLLDSGAMVSVLVNTNGQAGLDLPPDVLSGNIGAGLGGYIEGYLGRVSELEIGEIVCRELLGNFQELPENVDTVNLNGRNGIIGNKLLSRFHLIIDYPGETLYYKTNRKFKKKDEFDKSGLVMIAADLRLNKFIVHDVLAGSPADEAGILAGDQVLNLNGTPSTFLSLGTIGRRLRKKEGKKIVLVVKREGERMKFRFNLRHLI